MSADALVSVVLPCFNAERFVAGALDSLLGQTYESLEIVALDDGSTDRTGDMLESYAARDRRLRVLHAESNRGLIAMLNLGVSEARGAYIARMDADDAAAPERIARQSRILSRRADLDVLGTAINVVSAVRGAPLRPRPVRCLEPGGARFMGLFATPVAHMTIVARAEVMRAHPYGLGPHSTHTEDYEMFARMLEAGVAIANVDEPLVTVRVSPHGVSLRHEQTQVANFVACARRHLERTVGLAPTAGTHKVLVNRLDDTTSARDLVSGLRCLDELERRFRALEPTSKVEVSRIADLQRVDILIQATLRGSLDVRAAALGLAARYAASLSSPCARRYLGSKLPRFRRAAPPI